jgi:hypothetical protein
MNIFEKKGENPSISLFKSSVVSVGSELVNKFQALGFQLLAKNKA